MSSSGHVADTLIICMNQACLLVVLRGFYTPSRSTCIPLLLYVDDTIFCYSLSRLLDLFTFFSGLQINVAKSAFVGLVVSFGGDSVLVDLGKLIESLPYAT